MSDLDEDKGQGRFFTDQEKDVDNSDQHSLGGDTGDEQRDSAEESDDDPSKKCVTLRYCQRICPCLVKKTLWNTSQNNIFKLNEVEETKYPLILTILEHPAFDIVCVISAVLSIFLLLFSEGFLIDGAILWGIIHLINTVYTLGVCGRWLEILLKSKFAKTNQQYSIRDIVYSILSVIPLDIIVLLSYKIATNQADNDNVRHADTLWLTPIRMLYLVRARTVLQFFKKYEDLLQIDDMRMYIGRAVLYTITLVHFMACSWHRIHCEGIMGTIVRRHGHIMLNISFEAKNYDRCYEEDWITGLQIPNDGPFRTSGKGWHQYIQHYFVAVYWATLTCFRLGASSIRTYLSSKWEILFSTIGQILSWAFVVMYVSGGLTSLLVEIDSQREDYLNRRFAIEKYLDFTETSKRIKADVERFYDYLWTRSRGIRNWDMVKDIPLTMKSEIYFNINKFIIDQLPILSNLYDGFLTSLSVKMKHSFFVKGEALHRRGETGSTLYYVISGYLEVMSSDGNFVLAEIRAGSVIGELYLLQSYPCVATVRCGTECDIMTLSKKDFKEVLNNYPDNREMLIHKLEMRLEQSGLLLGLCERHNIYPNAFQQLEELYSDSNSSNRSRRSGINIEGLDDYDLDIGENAWEDSLDNLNPNGLSQDTIRRLRTLAIATEGPVENTQNEQRLQAAVCAAVEADVHRAGNLARDLHMARPPLIVTQPRNLTSSRSSRASRFSIRDRIVPKIITEKYTPHTWKYFMWKFVVAVSAICAFCFYTYQIAFADHRLYYLVYVWHIFDVVSLADFILEMFFIPVDTRHKLLQKPLEIGAHQVKTFEFWLRIFGFLPLEYAIAYLPFVRWAPNSPKTASLYAILKMNRILQYRQCLQFFYSFNENGKISRIILPYVRFILKLFFVAHITACIMEIILKNTHGHKKEENAPELIYDHLRHYEFVFYWACQIITRTGFGDIDLKSSWEFAVCGIGLVVGTLTLVYLNARISCVMVNSERRRVAFHQTYYSLKKFMQIRRFPHWLEFRIRTFFRVQWIAHEGTLITKEQNAIWDAPTTLFHNVCLAQAQKYVERIPLFRYCNDALVLDICSVLKQYVVPPHQVILYPCDRARSLYVISKGYCMVSYKGEQLGLLGEGRYFGLPGVVYGRNKPVKVSTATHCHFFCLEYDDFSRVSKKYHKFLLELKVLRGEIKSKTKLPVRVPNDDLDDDPEIPIPTRDESGAFPPLFNDVEVDDTADVDSEAETTETILVIIKRQLVRALKTSFVRTPRKSIISYFFFSVTILPSGPFLKWWTVFRVLCAIIIGNFVPCQAVFPILPVPTFLTVFCFDLIAWIDMFLCFHVGYYGHENMLVADRKRTVLHYLSSSFILDFLGCFPIDYIAMMVFPGSVGLGKRHFFTTKYQIIALCRLNRMLQLYRIFSWGKVLERGIFKSLSFLTLLQVVPLMFLYLNVMCCISYALVCKPSNNFTERLIVSSGPNNTQIRDDTPDGIQVICNPKGWIMGGDFYGHRPNKAFLYSVKPFLAFVTSFYFVAQSSFCVGFGDFAILPSSLNRQLVIFLMISGAIVCAYLISKLTACFVGEDPRRIEIRNRCRILFRFLEQFKVSKDLRRRVKEACFAEWDKTIGIFPKDLFSALPPTLKLDVFKCLYEDSLRQSPMFKDIDKGGIRMLSSKLTESSYPEGEYIFKYGDLNYDIYFLARGVVVSYTKNGDLIRYFGPGSLVGEMTSLNDLQRMFTVIAGTDTQLYVFKKEDFLEFLNLYPDIRETCEKLSASHYRETIEATIRRNMEIKDTSLEPGSSESKDSEDLSRSGSVIKSPSTHLEFSVKGSQVLFAESVLDPLRLPALIEEGDNIRNSMNSKGRSGRNSRRCCEKFISFFITFGRKPRHEMGLFHIVPGINKLTFNSAVIHPASPICNYVTLYLLIATISCGFTIFEICFTQYGSHRSTEFLWIRIVIEIFFVLRIIGKFRLAYYDKNSELISNPCLIAKRYALDPLGLWADVISTLPFYLISHFSGRETFDNNRHLRGHQFLRCILVFIYLNETELQFRMNSFRIKAIKVCLFLAFTFHFCACAWYRLAFLGPRQSRRIQDLFSELRSSSWMGVLMKKEIAKARQDYNDHPHMYEFHSPTFSLEHRYLLSLYYVCSAVTFTGIGDIAATRNYEVIFTVFMIFVTVFVLGYLVGEITQSVTSKVAAKMRYKHRLQVMEHHFQYLGLGETRIDEIKKYFMLLWVRCNGVCFTDLLRHLPYTLRADLTMFVYGPNIKYSRLYGNLDKDIIRQLSAEIRHEIFLPGTHIVRSGDICQAVYFIKKGEVVIIDESPGVELCVEILYENECFGEVKTILTGKQFRFSYVTRLETEVGVLFQDDLVRILKKHGRAYDDTLEKAREIRDKKLKLAREHEKVSRLSRQTIRSKTSTGSVT